MPAVFGMTAFAAPASPFSAGVQQADGTQINIQGHGDEFFHWVEDENGHVIAYDEENGNWCYAFISADGEITAGTEAVGGNGLARGRSGLRITRDDIAPLLENIERQAGSIAPYNDGDAFGSFNFYDSMVAAAEHTKNRQPLLVLLIEYNDRQFTTSYASAVGMDVTGYWSNNFFGNTGKTVNTYFKEVSGTFDLQFTKPSFSVSDGFSATTGLPTGVSSVYIKDGVAQVRLSKNHPNTTTFGGQVESDVSAAFNAVKQYINFSGITRFENTILCEDFNVTSVLAGFDGSANPGMTPSIYAHANWWYLANVYGRQRNYSIDYTSNSTGILRTYAAQGELFDATSSMPVGVFAHELGHILGLHDLYSYIGGEGIGPLSLMAGGSWGTDTIGDTKPGNTPTHLDAWSKVRLGFATATSITSTQHWKNNVNSIEDGYNILKVTNTAASPSQFFVVDNRQTIGYDRGLLGLNYGGSGILIYHIDEKIYDAYDYVGTTWRGGRPNDNDFHKYTHVEKFPYYPFYVAGDVFDATSFPNSNFHANNSNHGPGMNPTSHIDCCPQNLASDIRITVNSPSGNVMEVEVGGSVVIPEVILTQSNPSTTVNVGAGVSGRVPVTITAPPHGSVVLVGTEGSSNDTDPALYNGQGATATRIAYQNNSNNFSYTIPAGQTETVYAGTGGNVGRSYVITSTWPMAPEVLSVTISPKAVDVQKGEIQQFIAGVTTTGGADESVVWSVSGNEDSGTTIDGNGLLTVAADETAMFLTVTAMSAFDNTKFDTATVTVMVMGSTYLHEFPDENFRNAVLELLNDDGGSRTSDSIVNEDIELLAGITYLSVSNGNIGDMAGLRYFTGLEMLYCDTNRLTELDLSANPALYYLDCDNNQLTELDVSGNYFLAYLNCRNNHMESSDAVTGWQEIGLVLNSTFFFDPQKDPNDSPNPPAVHSVTISPPTAEVHRGDTQQFTATVFTSGGASNAVSWKISGNNSNDTIISTSGLLSIADNEAATTLTVTATSVFDTSKSASAAVTIPVVPEIMTFYVLPESAPVQKGTSQKFHAIVNAVGGADVGVDWYVSGGSDAETTIDEDGILTVSVNETATSLTVTAVSVFDDGISDTVTVTVTDETVTPEVYSVTILPGIERVGRGETRQFEAIVAVFGGADQSITWSVSGHTSPQTKIDANGLLTVSVNESAVTLTVTGTSVFDTSKSDSATVTLAGDIGIPTSPASIHITPAQNMLQRGESMDLTATVLPEGADLASFIWTENGDFTFSSKTTQELTLTAKNDTPLGSHEISAELEVDGVTYRAYAEVFVYENAEITNENFSVTLLEKAATVNRAQTRGALVPVQFREKAVNDGMSSVMGSMADMPYSESLDTSPVTALEVKLLNKQGVPLSNFTATLLNDKTIEIKARAGAGNINGVQVRIGDILAEGSLNIKVTEKYPKISLAATTLDLSQPEKVATIRAVAGDGARLNIEHMEIVTARGKAPLATVSGQNGLLLTNAVTKTGSVKVRLTLASPDYLRLAKNSRTRSMNMNVSIINSVPSIKTPKKADALTTKGKIDIVNPESSITAAISSAHGKISSVELVNRDGNLSEEFTTLVTGNNIFQIEAKSGSRVLLGSTYELTVRVNPVAGGTVQITKPLKIKPVRTATKTIRDKSAVTLYAAAPRRGEDISLAFASPNNAKLGAVSISEASQRAMKLDNGRHLELIRGGEDIWNIRFNYDDKPLSANGGKKLKSSYKIRLELWPEGTYILAGERPVALGKAKPTTVTLKVNVR